MRCALAVDVTGDGCLPDQHNDGDEANEPYE
jgi:hypothetical protein